VVDRPDIRANDQPGLPLPPALDGTLTNKALVIPDRSFFDSLQSGGWYGC
jgi:hypothetical protein